MDTNSTVSGEQLSQWLVKSGALNELMSKYLVQVEQVLMDAKPPKASKVEIPDSKNHRLAFNICRQFLKIRNLTNTSECLDGELTSIPASANQREVVMRKRLNIQSGQSILHGMINWRLEEIAKTTGKGGSVMILSESDEEEEVAGERLSSSSSESATEAKGIIERHSSSIDSRKKVRQTKIEEAFEYARGSSSSSDEAHEKRKKTRTEEKVTLEIKQREIEIRDYSGSDEERARRSGKDGKPLKRKNHKKDSEELPNAMEERDHLDNTLKKLKKIQDIRSPQKTMERKERRDLRMSPRETEEEDGYEGEGQKRRGHLPFPEVMSESRSSNNSSSSSSESDSEEKASFMEFEKRIQTILSTTKKFTGEVSPKFSHMKIVLRNYDSDENTSSDSEFVQEEEEEAFNDGDDVQQKKKRSSSSRSSDSEHKHRDEARKSSDESSDGITGNLKKLLEVHTNNSEGSGDKKTKQGSSESSSSSSDSEGTNTQDRSRDFGPSFSEDKDFKPEKLSSPSEGEKGLDEIFSEGHKSGGGLFEDSAIDEPAEMDIVATVRVLEVRDMPDEQEMFLMISFVGQRLTFKTGYFNKSTSTMNETFTIYGETGHDMKVALMKNEDFDFERIGFALMTFDDISSQKGERWIRLYRYDASETCGEVKISFEVGNNPLFTGRKSERAVRKVLSQEQLQDLKESLTRRSSSSSSSSDKHEDFETALADMTTSPVQEKKQRPEETNQQKKDTIIPMDDEPKVEPLPMVVKVSSGSDDEPMEKSIDVRSVILSSCSSSSSESSEEEQPPVVKRSLISASGSLASSEISINKRSVKISMSSSSSSSSESSSDDEYHSDEDSGDPSSDVLAIIDEISASDDEFEVTQDRKYGSASPLGEISTAKEFAHQPEGLLARLTRQASAEIDDDEDDD